MYRNLWINAPKEPYEYPDYPIHEHFKINTHSYMPGCVFNNYVLARFEKANIKQYIQFTCAVRYVTYDEEKKKFHARIQKLKTG